jgi:hypothetical protein
MSAFVGARMRAAGFGARSVALAQHWTVMLIEQVAAVVPITLQLVLTMAIFFGRGAADPGALTWGLACAILGLTLFVDALRVAVMPLGEVLGEELPKRLPLWAVLAIACVLGILCTYAEPAIASLRPLARIVSRTRTPYLHLVLNELQEPLIFSIGLGVGVAAMLGMLRFLRGWSLKPLIAATLLPAVVCAAYMQWGNPELRPLIGLAWDCGAVTTGPVTVPILLALGIGVMKTRGEKAKARAALEEAVNTGSGQQPTLEGFGIVTLASLLPVLAVEILAISSTAFYSREDIVNAVDAVEVETDVDVSPLREVVFAVRAILPLNVALICIVLFVLRMPMPRLSVYVAEDQSTAVGSKGSDASPAEAEEPFTAAVAAVAEASGGVVLPLASSASVSNVSDEAAPGAGVFAEHRLGEIDGKVDINEAAGAAAPDNSNAPAAPAATAAPAPPASFIGRIFPHGPWALVIGVFMAQIGQILFNLGLTFGFTAIGDQVGQLPPASFLQVAYESRSPFFSFGGGVALTLVTVFLLGFLATRAEPALNVLGRTVEKLSRGSFPRSMLVYSVCLGVGTGMAIGSVKILFGVPIMYFILAKYGVAVLLTLQANEDFTNIAWDSAGVTTGPVTVPFVLSTGIGFSKAATAEEGFGILTCASVAPIITVLLADLLRRTYAARRSLAKVEELRVVAETAAAEPAANSAANPAAAAEPAAASTVVHV